MNTKCTMYTFMIFLTMVNCMSAVYAMHTNQPLVVTQKELTLYNKWLNSSEAHQLHLQREFEKSQKNAIELKKIAADNKPRAKKVKATSLVSLQTFRDDVACIALPKLLKQRTQKCCNDNC